MQQTGKYKEIFGLSVLPKMFPSLRGNAHQGGVLTTIFDALCWQIRLTLLHPHSIHRVGKILEYSDESRCRIVQWGKQANRPTLMFVDVTFHWVNVNRQSYADMHENARFMLPHRGMLPPSPLFMVKDMTIEGDEPLARILCDKFLAFPEFMHGQRKLLTILKLSIRNQLADQPFAWLALQEEISQYYRIFDPATIVEV